MSSAFEVNAVSLGYGKIQVVHELTLSVPQGQVVSLLGPNGAGKTSLVRGIAGFLPLSSGEIRVGGAVISGKPPHRVVRSGVGVVPQGRELFPRLSVLDNLRLGAFTARRREVDVRVEATLAYFPRLQERMAQMASRLSGGEQQMLAIARALMSRPAVLILDEPSAGLAPQTMRHVFDIVAAIAASEGTTVFMAEQNAYQALRITHYAYIIEAGRLVKHGTPKELMRDDSVRAAYLGDSPSAAAQP